MESLKAEGGNKFLNFSYSKDGEEFEMA